MLALKCELCGATIYGKASTIEIDGAILQVCEKCSRFGKRVTSRPSAIPVKRAIAPTNRLNFEEELVVREDFHILIKRAREGLGLTQEELGRKLGEKTSVISKLETGKLKPSIPLARKIEHALKIKILEEVSE